MQLNVCRSMAALMLMGAPALAQQYELVDLGTLGGSLSSATDITEGGLISGYASTRQGVKRAVIWVDGQIIELGAPDGHVVAEAVAANEAGQVAVTGEDSNWTHMAYLWEAGQWTALGTLPGHTNSIAEGIDETGHVVGRSFIPGQSSNTRGFVWDSGVLTDLSTLGLNSYAYGVGPDGPIVGSARVDIGGGLSHSRAVAWHDGVIEDLGVLAGEDESQASAVNANGDVAGTSWHIIPVQFTSAYQATLWRANGEIVDLGLTPALRLACVDGFPFWTVNRAYGVNVHGDVVGHAHCAASGGAKAAFVWRDGVNHNLNTLVANLDGWDLLSARDINDAGQIVGFGLPPGSNRLRAFLLEPIVTCPPDINNDGVVDTLDFLAFLNLFADGDAQADFNEDGTVNTLDFIAFLNAFEAGC